jgi:tripeptide aminopeptidase
LPAAKSATGGSDVGDPRDERLLATFLDLVRIDSPSGSESACAAYCEGALRATGCSVRCDESMDATGADVGNLFAELPGTAPGTLAFSAHLDCVMPCIGVEPIIEDGVLRSAGATVLGGDDKSGVAAILEAVRRLAEDGGAYPTIRVFFSVSEEIGLVGAKAMSAEDVGADLCLVLDADGSPGDIVVAAPTHYTFRADFRGRASHAGVAPEKGISAIALAAKAVASLRIGRLDDETTANVGTIDGGTATNVIAAECTVTGECRSLDPEKVESLRLEMDGALHRAASEGGGEVEVAWKREYGGFRFSEDDPAVALISRAAQDVGLESHTYATGGGSDANILSALGVPTFALACGMSGVHSVDETLAVADLEAVTRLIVAVARRMAQA